VSGDVQGRGFRSAVVMGRLRSAIRAYALEGRQPHEALALTDRKLQHFEPTEMTTVLCAAFAPPYDDALLSSGGHPPPYWLLRTGRPRRRGFLPPLGAIGDVARSSDRVAMPEGAVLLLYTDGLIERRGETLDVGFERLCATLLLATRRLDVIASCRRFSETQGLKTTSPSSPFAIRRRVARGQRLRIRRCTPLESGRERRRVSRTAGQA
jgi:serine phosphatase RsbU (regulator of sigma subunit)